MAKISPSKIKQALKPMTFGGGPTQPMTATGKASFHPHTDPTKSVLKVHKRPELGFAVGALNSSGVPIHEAKPGSLTIHVNDVAKAKAALAKIGFKL